MFPAIHSYIGNTPMLTVPHPNARILAKAEWYNAAGSVKDRVAYSILKDARTRQLLRPGGTVIEATSGNTGIALAAMSASLGYLCIIVMPENMSRERIQRMRACGAQVILSSAEDGMAGAVKLARLIQADTPGSFLADQFQNSANPKAHFDTTGPEIYQQCGGVGDIFLSGVGSGGTITGVGHYLRQQLPHIRIIALHPAPGEQIPGLGAGFLPAVFDQALVDEDFFVTCRQATAAARNFAKMTGLLVGFSSGAALHAALSLADKPENTGKTILTILADSGQNYLSTELFP